MKKITLSVLILLPLFLFSQKGSLVLGVHGGLNLSHLYGKEDMVSTSMKIKPGFNSGVYVHYYFNHFIGIGAAVDYSRIGTFFRKITYQVSAGETITQRQNCRYDYMQFPLLVTCDLGVLSPKVSGMHIGIGPVFSYLVRAEVTPLISPDGQPWMIYPEFYLMHAKRFDFGLMFNFKPVFQVKRFTLEPEIGYYLGLLKPNDSFNLRNGNLFLRANIGYVLK